MEAERKVSRAETERYDLEILLRRPSLRTNLPRRTSQIVREEALTKETTCGIGCLRGQWFQSFANTKAYIFIYEVLGCFYGSYYAYFYGTITTLEKRFHTPSTLMGIISSASDITQILMYLVWSCCMPKYHRPRWVGFGIYIVIGSTVVSTLPYFLYSSAGFEYQENSTYHRNETLEEEDNRCQFLPQACSEEGVQERTSIIFIILARVLHGVGGSLYFALGTTYSNDNVKIYQGPALLSLLSILKILGPAFGYWLSSVSLKIFVSPAVIPDINETNPQWIGAWWLGNLLIGFMLLLPATMIILFPTTLPKAAIRKVSERLKGVRKIEVTKGKMEKLKSLIFNPTFNCNNFAGLFNIIGFFPYFIFLPKYAEIQFRLPCSSANLITGSVTLIFSALGLLIASSIITRYRPNARNLAAWIIFVDIISVGGFIAFIYVRCPGNDDHIKTFVSQMPSYNSTIICDCGKVLFSQVCNEKETLTSVCHAICKSLYYSNKTKVHNDWYQNLDDSIIFMSPFEPDKKVDCHYNFILFVIITCSISFINATSQTSHFLFQRKCLNGLKRSSFLNGRIVLLKFFAFLPSTILCGYILDQSCLFWEKTCTGNGNCRLYDTAKLRYTMNITAVGFTAVTIIFDLGIWYLVKNLVLFDDDDDDDDDENDVGKDEEI